MEQDEARVGVYGGERIEGDRVMGALERPPAANPAALEDLQGRVMVLVGRALVGGEQPPAVGRHVGDRLPRQAREGLARDRNALGWVGGVLVVNRLHRRIEVFERRLPRRAASTRGPDRKFRYDGGGTLSVASHRSSARLCGS